MLYLRQEEKKIFDALPEKLKEGWNVTEEKLNTYERPEEIKMRALMFKVEDPLAYKLLEKMKNTESLGTLQELSATFNTFSKATMLDIFFTLGTNVLSALLKGFLASTKADEDLKGIAELSAVRHALLESNAALPLSHA